MFERYRDPPLATWSALLASVEQGGIFTRYKDALRNEIVEAAHSFAAEKRRYATTVSIELSPIGPLDSQRPLIAVGHQPVIYHSGLIQKHLDSLNLAKDHSANLINIIIDSDSGSPGVIRFPIIDAYGKLRRSAIDVTDGSGIYATASTKKDAADLFSAIIPALHETGTNIASRTLELTRRCFHSGGTIPWTFLNSILREAVLPEITSHEIPLSVLAQLPSSVAYFDELLGDPEKLFTAYNAALDAFRAEQKIKNPANPFPNLKGIGRDRELPFWVIEGNARRAFTMGELGGAKRVGRVVPRGGLITYFFRTIVADLFIHGRGGESYDKFLPTFARIFADAPLAPLAVSSATRLLFPKEASEVTSLEIFVTNKKELISHTKKHLALLPQHLVSSLAEVLEKRDALLSQVRIVTSDRERSGLLHALNEINNQIRRTLEPWINERIAVLKHMTDEEKSTIFERTFPFWIQERASESQKVPSE